MCGINDNLIGYLGMVTEQEELRCGAILLPGVVVFPNNAVPLHIFEPRYRKMLSDAVEGGGCFVIGSLLEEEVRDGVEPRSIAVLVDISVNKALPDGRSLLIVSAKQRVKVLSWDMEGVYPRAICEKLERKVSANSETIIALLKDSFAVVLDKYAEKELELLCGHLDTIESQEVVIDLIAQHTIRDDGVRRFMLEEESDSKRAAELLLLLETM